MRDGVVPGRAWAVVTEVIAIHVAIGGKPDGVVIDTLTGAIERQRARLATRRDSFGIGALGNMGGGRRNIDQGPVIEINTRQGAGYFTVFLIDVVGLAGYVGVVADHHIRLRGRRRI